MLSERYMVWWSFWHPEEYRKILILYSWWTAIKKCAMFWSQSLSLRGVCAQSASEAIFNARACQSHNFFSPVMMILDEWWSQKNNKNSWDNILWLFQKCLPTFIDSIYRNFEFLLAPIVRNIGRYSQIVQMSPEKSVETAPPSCLSFPYTILERWLWWKTTVASRHPHLPA